MLKILITGSAGFVGRNLIDQLVKRHTVTGCDLVQPADFILDLNSNYSSDLLQHYNIVLHCAAKTRIPASWDNYRDYYETNITASQRLLAQCQAAGVRKLIYFSSSSVYGNNGCELQHEDGPVAPASPYAVSKLASEYALMAQATKGDTQLIIVRPFTMYGEYMDHGAGALAIAKFLNAKKAGEPLILEGGGQQRRDYVHIRDAAQAIGLIIESGQHGDIYNIGSGVNVSIKEIADCISSNQIIAPARHNDTVSTLACIDKLRRLGYAPQVDILDWLSV